MLHPENGVFSSHSPDSAIHSYCWLQDDLKEIIECGKTREEAYGLMGNQPDGKPITEAYVLEQFRKQADGYFQKITGPKYDLVKDSIARAIEMDEDLSSVVSAQPERPSYFRPGRSLQTHIQIDPKYSPNYSKLHDAQGSPLLNPETGKPYTADDMTKRQATIELR